MDHPIAWIAADWGTSHLRVFAIDGEGGVIGRAHSEDGMAALAQDRFEPALLALIDDWLSPDGVTEVFACGMVGARQGWIEAAYGPVPGPALGADPVAAPTRDPRLAVTIVPGLAQPDPADVMRGEETQIAGLLAREPGFEGAVCLPGTHSKWVRIENGAIARFTTFMTGELFALVAGQSVLRHSLAGDGWSDEGFEKGLGQGLEAPQGLTGQLFSLRAESLLHDRDPVFARSRLSGMLIGAEIAAARSFWGAGPVALIGEGRLSALYEDGLAEAGAASTIHDAETLTLAGLAAARQIHGKGLI